MKKIIAQDNQNDKQISKSIKRFFVRFHISSALKAANAYKKKGVPVFEIFQYLFLLVFSNRSMYMSLATGKNTLSFAKDTVYRFMKMTNINWIQRHRLSLQKGTEAMLELLKAAKTVSIPAGYVLFGSWFSSPSTLHAVKRLGYDVIGMVKKTPKMFFRYNGEDMPLTDICKKNRKRRGKSGYLLSVIVEAVKDGETIPAKVVYVRNRNKRKEYLCLISTDTSLDEDEIIRIYGKRWDTEVFF